MTDRSRLRCKSMAAALWRKMGREKPCSDVEVFCGKKATYPTAGCAPLVKGGP